MPVKRIIFQASGRTIDDVHATVEKHIAKLGLKPHDYLYERYDLRPELRSDNGEIETWTADIEITTMPVSP